ncbi:MAG: hypothetical protein M0Q15_00095 [Nevskia sp.]|jgi:hypothetical protein|nr:hypothetical protein [Nevskia sp.]
MTTLQIKEFQFDNCPWRIVWLGRINYPPGRSDEPRITVHLAQLKASYGDPLSNAAFAETDRHETVAVKAGLLAFLKLGSVWVNGIKVAPRQPAKRIDVIIRHDQIELLNFDAAVSLDGASPQPLFSPTRYRVGKQVFPKIARSWLAVIYNPTPQLKILAIPSTVLFQKCLATSPDAIRRLLYGEIDKIIDARSGFLPGKPITYFIELFKDFLDSEGKMAANLKADQVAEKEFARFRQALAVETVNYDRSRAREPETHLKLGLPFSNPAKISMSGKYLPFDSIRNGQMTQEWGFLATELIGFRVRLVFDRLIIDRKNNNKRGGNADDPDLQKSWGGTQKKAVEFGDTITVTSDEEPSDEFEKLAVETSGDFEAEGLEVIKEGKELQKYRNIFKSRRHDREPNGHGTTGDLTPGGSGAVEVDAVVGPPPSIPVKLDSFFEVLEKLNALGYSFKTIAASSVVRRRDQGGGIVSFFPREIAGMRGWHLCGDSVENAPPRGYIVAESHHGGIWRYLIELERKGNEKLSTLYVRAHSGSQLEGAELKTFMRNVAKANGWNVKMPPADWILVRIRHEPDKGVRAFVRNIVKVL